MPETVYAYFFPTTVGITRGHWETVQFLRTVPGVCGITRDDIPLLAGTRTLCRDLKGEGDDLSQYAASQSPPATKCKKPTQNQLYPDHQKKPKLYGGDNGA